MNMSDSKDPMIGEVVDDRARYTLREVCEQCGVSAEHVIELVQHGVLHPEGREPVSWRFSSRMLIRSRKAHRLRRDLDLNLPGLALCLELLDEVESLRREVKVLRRRDPRER